MSIKTNNESAMSWKIGQALATVKPERRREGGYHWMPMAKIKRETMLAQLSRSEGQPCLSYEEARDMAKSWARALNKIYGEG